MTRKKFKGDGRELADILYKTLKPEPKPAESQQGKQLSLSL